MGQLLPCGPSRVPPVRSEGSTQKPWALLSGQRSGDLWRQVSATRLLAFCHALCPNLMFLLTRGLLYSRSLFFLRVDVLAGGL